MHYFIFYTNSCRLFGGYTKSKMMQYCTNPRNKDTTRPWVRSMASKKKLEIHNRPSVLVLGALLWKEETKDQVSSLRFYSQSTSFPCLLHSLFLSLSPRIVTLEWLKLPSFDRANHGPMLVIKRWRPATCSSLPIPRRWSFFVQPWLSLWF